MKEFLKYALKVTRKFAVLSSVAYVGYQVGFVVGVSKGDKA